MQEETKQKEERKRQIVKSVIEIILGIILIIISVLILEPSILVGLGTETLFLIGAAIV